MKTQNEHFTTRHYVAFVVVILLIIAGGLWAFNRLSPDAIGMALGLGFGVLAGIPAALLVLVASRPRSPYDYLDDDDDYERPQTIIFYPIPLAPPPAAQPTALEAQKMQQRAYVYDDGTTRWRYPIEGMQMINGEATQYIEGVTLTNSVEFALRTGSTCVVRLDEWERHIQAQADAQGMNRYAFFH